ncbi:MAG TPA: hypothetical protein VF520_13785 [Thermoleophilaceae bacterium]|jgi:hypothetical protein
MRRLIAPAIVVALAVPAAADAQLPSLPELNSPPPAKRDTEPIVLHGSDLGQGWSAPSNQTLRLPLMDIPDCPSPERGDCDNNKFEQPQADSGNALGDGTAVDRLLGYRFDPGSGWRQIPFQVDQVFTRYLDNTASGFSFYSGEDQHTTYEYDREGYRYRASDPSNPCLAKPDPSIPEGRDPVRGLDDNDELSFMWSDAGAQAPPNTTAPAGIDAVREVAVDDPRDSSAPPRYVYVMRRAASGGPRPAFDASNGYVRYKRDAISDTYELSQSSYSDYGNARTGKYCDAKGNVVVDDKGQPKIGRRRPRDYAWITTDRYRFRYDGRWLMTQIRVSPNGGKSYGPDLIDRWKARAFAQDPGSKTPCCGYEEEDTNWGGSSTLLGERVGPVRAIRETWGADSGTNVVRRETFYRAEMRQHSWLRVHPIPPLDGIYAQWDFNAGRVTSFFNGQRPDGVKIDGKNDEVFGNFDDPCNDNYDANDTSDVDQGYRDFYRSAMVCDLTKAIAENDPTGQTDYYHQSIDAFDPTMHKANVGLEWSEVAGPWGTIVDRFTADVRETSPGGLAQSLAATPYYRDDSCFDDGTGTDPGPKVKLRSGDEPQKAADGTARRCWTPEMGVPDGSDHLFQGSIGTHGMHLLFIADSDNARATMPVSEIVSQWRMVMLPGDQTTEQKPCAEGDPGCPPSGGGGSTAGGAGGPRGSEVGQAYGAAFDAPLETRAGPAANVVDRTRPRVRLRVARRMVRGAVRLALWGEDTGGSGLRALTLQVKRGGKWRTLSTSTKRRSYLFHSRARRATFRLRAQDRAGNRSAWRYLRADLR